MVIRDVVIHRRWVTGTKTFIHVIRPFHRLLCLNTIHRVGLHCHIIGTSCVGSIHWIALHLNGVSSHMCCR